MLAFRSSLAFVWSQTCIVVPIASPRYQTSFIDSSGNGSGYITGPGTYEVLFAGIGDYEGMITGYINVTDDDQVQLSNCDMKVNGRYGNEFTLRKSEVKDSNDVA